MADERIVTSIVANSDFSNLIADVQRVTSSLFKLQQELAGTNRALSGQIDAANAMFNQTMLKTGQFSSHFVSLSSDVEKFGRNLDGGRLKLKDYFRVYQDHARTSGGLIRDLAKQQVQLQNAILQPLGRNAQGLMQYNVHIPRGLDLTKNKTSILKQELQIMNKVIQDGGVQLINWGKNTQWAGRQLTVGLTLPLAAFGKAAADAFKVADQELTRLTKVYGDVAGTSQQELGRVRKEVSATAKELSAAMGVSFAETIGLAADIAATGKTGNELLASVSETTRLAVLGEVDRQEAMKATLAIQSAFKANTDELAQSINFLNAVENQTSTTLNDLVEAIPKAGPVIKGLGGSVQDLALYLTAMREGGINASEGANALKSALASLINPTDVAVDKFKGFGIDLLGIVKNNAGDVTQTLFALQAALDRLDPLQKQQAIEQLFGKFQFSRLNALFENLGRQGSQTLQVLDLMKASAGDLEAVASRELTAVTESASGRYRRAVESLKAELAGVGDEFLNIGTKIVNFLSKIIDFAQKLPDPIKKVLAFGGAFTAIIGPVIMLTGVLANFFGYIIKGVGHFKALFKGAEGFQLLTPEIIAARAASSQLSDEFYSDALAADTLRLAIKKLAEDLALLQKNATNATAASAGLGQVLTTTAGTPITTVGGASRVVDPEHVLLGQRSRAAAHMNPRDPKNPSTIFGLTLQPIPVNRSIGKNPQILMEDRLEDIEGLTTIGGVSTGVVAPEHARYQALMATLGLQSKKEIEDLKKTIKFGGQVSSEFLATFDDILPITQDLTTNAARQSAAIVAELRAGKMTVQQARDAIIAVNAQLEKDLGIQVSAYGASRGRTIDLTKAPLIDQPVVDASGKPNVRGMYRKGIFAKVMDVLGRATRTRTLGGPYSIETTRPIQRNMGGPIPGYTNGEFVYMTNGQTVPGPNVNADVVPAMLTPGEFVLTRDVVAQQGSDAVEALHRGEAMIVPFGANRGGKVPGVQYKFGGGNILRILSTLGRWNPNAPRSARKVAEGIRPSTRSFTPSGFEYGPVEYAALEKRSRSAWQTALSHGARKEDEVLAHVITNKFLRPFKNAPMQGSTPVLTGSQIQERFGALPGGGAASKRYQLLPDNVVNVKESFNKALVDGNATGLMWLSSNRQPQHFISLISHLLNSGVPYRVAYRVAGRALSRINKAMQNVGDRKLNETKWGNIVDDAISREMQALRGSYQKGSRHSFNRGGKVPGYNRGGNVYGYARGVQRKILGGPMLRMLGPLALMFGGQKLGEKVGGGTGQAISTASWMLPMFMGGMGGNRPAPTVGQRLGFAQNESALSPMRQSIFAQTTPVLGKFATSLGNAATSGGKLTSSIAKLLIGVSRFAGVFGLATTAISAGTAIYKNYQKTQELSAAQFGMTGEQAQKAGLKFTDFNQKIKDAVAAQKLLVQQNILTYQNMTSAKTPFDMTITQYKALKKEVKETMSAQIEMINAVKPKDVTRIATQLKEQFVAMGMSAEEANKKIFALFSVSNKKNYVSRAMSARSFTDIVDPQTAAVSSVKTFNFAKEFENTRDQATALNTALMALDNSYSSIYSEAEEAARKKQQDFDEVEAGYTAEAEMLDEINSKVKNQKAIGIDVLRNLEKQNPLIGQFVNEQDNVVSMWQKIRIAARGYTGDLSALNAQQTQALYDTQIAVSKAVQETNRSGQLNEQYKALKQLENQQKSLITATRGQSVKEQISSREALKNIDKKIKKINEEAEARKKALREESQAEDVNLRIQQARLDYEKRVSAGDLTGAAEARLELQRILNEQQATLAEQAIEDRRAQDVRPLERRRENLQEAQQKLADKAALASENLESVNKKLTTQQEKIDAVNEAMTNYLITAGDANSTQEEINGAAARFVDALKKAGRSVEEYSYTESTMTGPMGVKIPIRQRTKLGAQEIAQNYIDTVSINKILAPKDMVIEASGKIMIGGKELGGTKSFLVTPQGSTVTTGKASGGLLRGPGTGTSDSIIGMYSNGGMVRVSNGEYIVNAQTVKDLGVPFFDAINGMKNGGLMVNYNVPRYSGGGELTALAPMQSGGLVNVTNNFEINAPEGIDTNALAERIAMISAKATEKALAKVGGPDKNISTRYATGRSII